MQNELPEWAFSKALEACNFSHGAGKFGVETIARALVAAERRGRLNGINEVILALQKTQKNWEGELPDFVNGADYAHGLAIAAIRQLGEMT